jgi:hypothetical protein
MVIDSDLRLCFDTNEVDVYAPALSTEILCDWVLGWGCRWEVNYIWLH